MIPAVYGQTVNGCLITCRAKQLAECIILLWEE